MEKHKLLIENIQKSNLSQEDKRQLITILSDDNLDLDLFIKNVLKLCKVGKEIFKLFDIDIGE